MKSTTVKGKKQNSHKHNYDKINLKLPPRGGKKIFTLDVTLEGFINYSKPRVTSRTLGEYRRHCGIFIEIMEANFGIEDPASMDVKHPDHRDAAIKCLEGYLNMGSTRRNCTEGKEFGIHTKNHIITDLKHFYNYVVKVEGTGIPNPLDGFEKFTTTKRELLLSSSIVSSIEKDLYEKAMANPNPIYIRNYLVFVLLAKMGFRGGKIGSFVRDDLYLKPGEFKDNSVPGIHIRKEFAKNKEARYIPLPDFNYRLWGKEDTQSSKKKSDFQYLLEVYYN